jgi:hypothetical protein
LIDTAAQAGTLGKIHPLATIADITAISGMTS